MLSLSVPKSEMMELPWWCSGLQYTLGLGCSSWWLKWTDWSIQPVLRTTAHLFTSCAKITMLGIAWVPLASSANNHPWNVWFCLTLEQKENNPILSIQRPRFTCIHRAQTFHPGLLYSTSPLGTGGTNRHLISFRGAHCTSLSFYSFKQVTAKLK